MVVINYSGEEINAKIVYYGPGLSGKTTNLEFIYSKMPSEVKGKMVSMKTRTDRTLFFDFLPIELGDISGYRTRFLLYTVPGQVYYNATRKLVLKGADAVVFVADSSRSMLDDNVESLRNLEENLNEHDLTLDTIPWVIQYNKRDVEDAMSVEELDEQLNLLRVPSFEAVATEGSGIYETFQGIARLLYLELKRRFEGVGMEQTDRHAVVEAAVENAVDKKVQTSAHAADGGRAMSHPAAGPAPSIPPSPKRAAQAPGESPDRSEEQETVSFVVDQALREVDSVPDFESEEDTVTNSAADRMEEGDEYRFASMNGMEGELGRELELDDAPKSPKPEETGWNDADRNGFIKDPCRTVVGEDKPSGEKTEKVQVEIEAVHDTVRDAPAGSEPVFTVPIVISRSQVRKTIPMKLILEIRITEDNA
jgi:signal recognition particle receptor subunit beta